ncbi:hypothetical protein JRO89_XS03G0051500 [Xanthoceras sorbifolium]|uniref:beta-galactosidase n=1 Tax=Xanthoceras sorbifolium TaxID=99658 RepID=A0ABQ8I8S4_9ROSI|nr:hypothetical protein JRO89_XS03G0051500 [Xanthoceras sorbifolium]
MKWVGLVLVAWGFPVWLRDIPGIEFRTDNAPFKIDSNIITFLSLTGKIVFDGMLKKLSEMLEAVVLKSRIFEERQEEDINGLWDGIKFLALLWASEEMQRFVKKIVDLMRGEMLFSWQGGPIIMLQVIENEYGNMESSYGQHGKDYVKWAARMALGLGAGVPWVMCKQTDAPEHIVKSFP